jgi:hypothetical protein
MSDINKVREWTDLDGHEVNEYGEYDWPYPTEVVESRVTGELREKVLSRTDRFDGEVLIIERVISGGHSEYTQENDYEFDVTIDGVKVWGTDHWSDEKNLAAFLAWVDGAKS